MTVGQDVSSSPGATSCTFAEKICVFSPPKCRPLGVSLAFTSAHVSWSAEASSWVSLPEPAVSTCMCGAIQVLRIMPGLSTPLVMQVGQVPLPLSESPAWTAFRPHDHPAADPARPGAGLPRSLGPVESWLHSGMGLSAAQLPSSGDAGSGQLCTQSWGGVLFLPRPSASWIILFTLFCPLVNFQTSADLVVLWVLRLLGNS